MLKQSIVEWFDFKNTEHVQAYSELVKTGKWPEDCPPKNVYLNCGWEIEIDRQARRIKN